jgi:fibronectin-binding autotransporter adhesin
MQTQTTSVVSFDRKNSMAIAARRRTKLGHAARPVLESLENRCLMTTAVWTGAGNDHQWNTAANWQNNAIPQPGMDVDFPNLGSSDGAVNLATGVEVGSITFDGAGYNISGSQQITLDGNITANANNNQIGSELLPTGSFTLTVAASDDLVLSGGADDSSDGYGFTKQGAGTLTLTTNQFYLTTTSEIAQGVVEVNNGGVFNGGFIVDTGTTLDAAGPVTTINGNGGTIVLGDQGVPASINNANVSLGSGTTFEETYNGNTFGELTSFGQTVDVTGATLSVVPVGNTAPTPGSVFTLISNQTGGNTTGNFNNLSEGQLFTSHGVTYQISYVGGGSGADVTLTVIGAAVWTGGAGDGLWNSAANWQGNAVPQAGQSVDFPDLNGSTVDYIHLDSDVEVGEVTMEGNYSFDGSSITVDGDITASKTADTFNNTIYLTHTTTVTVGTGDTLDAAGVVADNADGYGVTLVGGGTLRFDQEAAYAGPNVVQDGTLDNENEVDTAVTVDPGGTIVGGGYNDSGIIGNGGTISLGNDSFIYDLNTAGVSFSNGTTLHEELSSTSGVEGDGVMTVNGGTVNLAGGTLSLATWNSFAPPVGDVITLISNQTGTAVTGTFTGLPQGGTVAFGGVYYQVSYHGGSSGHDVTLTVVNPPAAVWTGGAGDGQWNNAANWQGNAVPSSGQSVEFPNLGSGDGTVNLATNVTVGDITFDGAGYTLSGPGQITMDGNITDNADGNQIDSTIQLTQDITVTVAASDHLALESLNEGNTSLALDKEGAGTLTFTGASNFSGGINLDQGEVDVASGADESSGILTSPGTTVYGNATIAQFGGGGGTIELAENGDPGTIISQGNSALGSGTTLVATVGPSSNGLLTCTGVQMDVSGANLNVALLNGAMPTVGQVITVISNQTGSPISGTFNNLPDGTTFTSNGVTYQISYQANGEDDVTLTVVNLPVAVWTDGGGDGQWNNPNNWQAGTVPGAGQAVDFPDLNGGTVDNVNLASDVTVGNITMEGNYSFGGASITADGSITANGSDDEFQDGLVLSHTTTISVGGGDQLITTNIPDAGSNDGINLTGGGTLLVGGSGSSTGGPIDVQSGTLLNESSVTSAITVDPGGTVLGNGTFNAGIVGNGGTISLGESEYSFNIYDTSVPSVTFSNGTTLHEELSNDGESGEIDGELTVNGGTIDLTGANLTLDTQGGFAPALGDVITLISNQTGSAVTGRFNGLAQGAIATFGGVNYQISYDGGQSGQDVTLTVVNPVTNPTVVSVMPTDDTSSARATLSILGEDPNTQNDSDLTYTWSVSHAPSGAKAVKFSENGTNAAKAATARFQKAGTYHLLCTISNGDGGTVAQMVSVTIKQLATSLRLTPHVQTIAAGTTRQYSGVVLDQFKHAMPTSSITYAVKTGAGRIDDAGLFTAGEDPGHVVIEMTVNGLTGTVGATVV